MTMPPRTSRPPAPANARSATPYGALFDRLRPATAVVAAASGPAGQDRLDALRQAAQLALQVEFSTIPVYLSGMYSISDPDAPAYQVLRSVVMEEMFHVNQAANLVAALGVLPRFTGAFAPVYPGYLPHSNEQTMPYLGLYRASRDVFSEVYAAIETPAPWDAPAQGTHYDTIAQLYRALVDAIHDFPGNPFDPARPGEGRQRTDIYLGKFGGQVLEVRDKDGAYAGIGQIVRQGEGVVPPDQPLVPREPFGTYNQYGQRTDGTYGPILGTPEELSHFMKFRHVSLDAGTFPATRPVVSNPSLAQFTNPDAKACAQLFNQAYSRMLVGFEQTFLRGAPDPFFGEVLMLMHEVLPQLAGALMAMPAQADGNGDVGPNAAPTWSWVDPPDLAELQAGVQRALGAAPAGDAVAAGLAGALQGLRKVPHARGATASHA